MHDPLLYLFLFVSTNRKKYNKKIIGVCLMVSVTNAAVYYFMPSTLSFFIKGDSPLRFIRSLQETHVLRQVTAFRQQPGNEGNTGSVDIPAYAFPSSISLRLISERLFGGTGFL